MRVACSSCGEHHDIGEISLGADSPAQWNLLSEAQKQESELTSDQCVIQSGGEHSFFVRACLDVPILGGGETFTWGVWVSLSEESFLEMSEHWSDPVRTNDGPYFGWLCTALPGYPDTMFLRASVHQREVGLRPTVELEATEHPLSRDQRFGVSRERMIKIVSRVLHGGDGPMT